MPKLSDTMEEGKILKWHKQPGDRVKQGDLLAEVETDKANMDIESFDEGVVAELRVAEGESAPVGAVI
ncbi:MAG: biotin/lipoyl-containing protein, partial [Candidatus Binatia bacterium]